MSPRPKASERLDRDDVVTSAIGIADVDGLDAVTLRRVAADWNVSAMALYWHFKDKDALLDAMVERMLGEVELDTNSELRAVMTGLLSAFRAHPSLTEIIPVRLMRTDSGIDLAERVIGLLREGGHSPEAAAQLSMLLLNGLVGLVTRRPGELAVADPAQRERLLADKRARLKSLAPENYPHLSTTADHFLTLPDEEGYYARGLEVLLKAAR